jgi:hypothetical protein
MPKVSEIGVKYRGSFKGSYIDIVQLIDNAVVMDVVDFTQEASCVKSCESYCKMQIRIEGKLYVTWHSSEMLATFLNDCKQKQETEHVAVFPIEECVIVVGDDRAYYLEDAPPGHAHLSEKDIDRMASKAKRNRR